LSASEFAFLAIGLLLGVASGAALMEVFRARPPAPREIRVTMTADSVPRRAATLAVSPFLPETERSGAAAAGDEPWAEPAPVGPARPATRAGRGPLVPATVSRSSLGRSPVAIAIEAEPDPMLEAIRADARPMMVLAGVGAAASAAADPGGSPSNAAL
jgi:hypothetical protein